MNEEEKEAIELDIEAKYVDNTEKEFLSRVTYAECLYILTPKNKYCDKIRELSVLKLCEIIEKLQKENERLKEKHKITCELNVGLLENMKECIPKHVIRDKFKRINETKIKIDKTNARDYMIFGNTERATGWFINIDYIEKILLDVPGYKIGDE